MYSRVMSIRLLPGKMDQALHIFRESIMPAIESRRGCVGVFVLTSREKDEIVTMSLWESYESMMAPELSDFIDQQLAKLTNVLREPPFEDRYELELMS